MKYYFSNKKNYSRKMNKWCLSFVYINTEEPRKKVIEMLFYYKLSLYKRISINLSLLLLGRMAKWCRYSTVDLRILGSILGEIHVNFPR
ncbi:hypothetical protein Btru_053110 [Bulinus truncatus]|nr:hypothetical protein Btru_053110 [Bulinus truncatus]